MFLNTFMQRGCVIFKTLINLKPIENRIREADEKFWRDSIHFYETLESPIALQELFRDLLLWLCRNYNIKISRIVFQKKNMICPIILAIILNGRKLSLTHAHCLPSSQDDKSIAVQAVTAVFSHFNTELAKLFTSDLKIYQKRKLRK